MWADPTPSYCGMKSLYTWSDPGSIPGRSTKAVHLLIVPSTASRGWNNTDEKVRGRYPFVNCFDGPEQVSMGTHV
jgi:hypothetical protein